MCYMQLDLFSSYIETGDHPHLHKIYIHPTPFTHKICPSTPTLTKYILGHSALKG